MPSCRRGRLGGQMNEDLREIVAKWLSEAAPVIWHQYVTGEGMQQLSDSLLALFATHKVVRLVEDHLPESELFAERQDILKAGFRRVVPLTGEGRPREY